MADYEFVDLTHCWGRNTPLWPWPGAMYDVKIERVAYLERDDKYTTLITTKMHVGTHTDAPAHVLQGGKTIEEMHLEAYHGTGVVVDIPKEKWGVVTPDDLERAEPKIREGDFVIVRTGWQAKYWKKNNYAYFNYSPGFYKEAGEWFVEKKVKAVGIDNSCIDHPMAHPPIEKYMPWLLDEWLEEHDGRHPAEDFPLYEPCHKLLLSNGIPNFENVGGDVEKVVGKRVTIIGFPLRYEQGDGSMVRLVALVDK